MEGKYYIEGCVSCFLLGWFLVIAGFCFTQTGSGIQLSTWLRPGLTSRVTCACAGTTGVVYRLFMGSFLLQRLFSVGLSGTQKCSAEMNFLSCCSLYSPEIVSYKMSLLNLPLALRGLVSRIISVSHKYNINK